MNLMLLLSAEQFCNNVCYVRAGQLTYVYIVAVESVPAMSLTC